MNDAQFIAGLPKAELHMHIEGSIEPGLFIELARRNGLDIPWNTEAELRAAYSFANLQAFLDLYYSGCRVLVTQRDFHDVTMEYLRRAHADGVLHTEMFLGPQGHTLRDVPLATAMEGVLGAMDEAERTLGIGTGLILLAQRHRSEDEALEMLDATMPWAHRILGFGIGGAEVGHPPQKFARFFRTARERGFRVVAHAGEEGPAAYVRDSLHILEVDRIDHGNACAQDPQLVSEIARRGIALTMCPLSNLKLQVIGSVADHPLKKLLDAGVRVTVNSDDPSYFSGYVNENFVACQEALGLTRRELAQIARNSFLGAFMLESRRAAALARLDAYEQAACNA